MGFFICFAALTLLSGDRYFDVGGGELKRILRNGAAESRGHNNRRRPGMSLHVGMIGAGAIADDHCTVVQKILDGIYASSASGKEVRIR